MINLNNHQKKALEIYHNDGHEKVWQYWKLTGHNYGIFLGEISSSQFITGDDLANHIGLSSGISQYSDTAWLKFILNGNIIIIPKKSIRHSISWEHIYQCGSVYGTDDFGNNPYGSYTLQDARVTIDDSEFRVTLLKGANTDPVVDETGLDIPFSHNSEWNHLIYPIHHDEHIPRNSLSTPQNRWASYSGNDLGIIERSSYGSYNLMQETHGFGNTYRITRGYFGISYVSMIDVITKLRNIGWRPALRLIQK